MRGLFVSLSPLLRGEGGMRGACAADFALADFGLADFDMAPYLLPLPALAGRGWGEGRLATNRSAEQAPCARITIVSNEKSKRYAPEAATRLILRDQHDDLHGDRRAANLHRTRRYLANLSAPFGPAL